MTYGANEPDSEAPTVGVGRHESAGNGSVLGVAVTDDAIISIVRGPAGDIVASNIVDLVAGTPQDAFDAVAELIDSVPMAVDAIGIAASREPTGAFLAEQVALGPSAPVWAAKVRMVDFPVALAEVARAEPTLGGVVAVVDLDGAGVPSSGRSIITVDVQSGAIVGTASFNDGSPAPITEPDGANAVADAVTTMPGGAAVVQVICTGAGAAVPGVAPAFEYAVARPVSIATAPELAVATGVAVSAHRLLSEPVRPVRTPAAAAVVGDTPQAQPRRWWPAAAAIVGALALGAIAGAVIADSAGSGEEKVSTASDATATVTRTTTKTVNRSRATVTETVRGDGATVTERNTETATATTTRTATRTVTETATETDMQTETETVTETPATVTVTTTIEVPAERNYYVPERSQTRWRQDAEDPLR